MALDEIISCLFFVVIYKIVDHHFLSMIVLLTYTV